MANLVVYFCRVSVAVPRSLPFSLILPHGVYFQSNRHQEAQAKIVLIVKLTDQSGPNDKYVGLLLSAPGRLGSGSIMAIDTVLPIHHLPWQQGSSRLQKTASFDSLSWATSTLPLDKVSPLTKIIQHGTQIF